MLVWHIAAWKDFARQPHLPQGHPGARKTADTTIWLKIFLFSLSGTLSPKKNHRTKDPLKKDDPDTNISAPLSITKPAVSVFIPPSTEIK